MSEPHVGTKHKQKRKRDLSWKMKPGQATTGSSFLSRMEKKESVFGADDDKNESSENEDNHNARESENENNNDVPLAKDETEKTLEKLLFGDTSGFHGALRDYDFGVT